MLDIRIDYAPNYRAVIPRLGVIDVYLAHERRGWLYRWFYWCVWGDK